VTIPWKFYLLFGHHIVDGISKNRYIQQIPWSAHVRFWFSGKYFFLSKFAKHIGPYIYCIFVFHGNHKVHSACKSFTHFPFAFLSWLNKVLVVVSFCPIGRSSVGKHYFRINLYTIRFFKVLTLMAIKTFERPQLLHLNT